jgi:hypothetical protein
MLEHARSAQVVEGRRKRSVAFVEQTMDLKVSLVRAPCLVRANRLDLMKNLVRKRFEHSFS